MMAFLKHALSEISVNGELVSALIRGDVEP
jgi:hypothetical protein